MHFGVWLFFFLLNFHSEFIQTHCLSNEKEKISTETEETETLVLFTEKLEEEYRDGAF